MDNKEYWIKEGKKKLEELKDWNPNGNQYDKLLILYFKKYNSESINEALGDLSDDVKDAGILSYATLLRKNKVVYIPTEEIKSEVVDYLKKNNYNYVVDNNKIELI